MPASPSARETPGRLAAAVFRIKVRAFQLRRALLEIGARPPRHRRGTALVAAPLAAERRSPLWTRTEPAEFPLTAGKVENLRLAARTLDGLEVPVVETFSFWRQLGRTTRRRGFTHGRELREGCLVPSTGGGLCQLSGLLYQAAIQAGLEVVERHAHSRVVPGSSAEQGLDATVFWNYVDLRFRAPFPWRLEVRLDTSELLVRIRTVIPVDERPATLRPDDPPRAAATGDCLTCGQTSCFRHPAASSAHCASLGHSAFLLDARWPEFDRWCAGHARDGDHWFLPLDGRRWNKLNYAWSPPAEARLHHATVATLLRSWRQRHLPAQGAVRQAALLAADARLARAFARRLSPECRHLVVSQNLLPHLWRLGVLGGRSFDVLLSRSPLAELHQQLDRAARAHPRSPTLADFRADADLVRDETAALAQAGRLITPHRALARRFGARAWLADWDLPESVEARPSRPASQPPRLFLPASPLGRKGIHELAAALRDLPAELLVLGTAREGGDHDPLSGLNWRPARPQELADCDALVLPAWVEHQPRLALRALALGIPVIATEACGLPDHPLLTSLAVPDEQSLRAAIAGLASCPATEASAIVGAATPVRLP